MFVKTIGFILVTTFLLLGTGCEERSSTRIDSQAELPPIGPDTVLRLHWLGKRQLGVEGSAFYFCRIWDLPETKVLEGQTLDKLATVPWRLLHGDAALSNAPVAALRPLLDNLRHEESYLEIRSSTNQPLAMALAVRLREDAANGWRNNLSIFCQSLTGIQPRPGRGNKPGWVLTSPQAQERFEFMRAGEWIVFGFAKSENTLVNELIDRVEADADPFGARGTDTWMRLDLDLNWFSSTYGVLTGLPFPANWLEAVVTGDGTHVITRAMLTFDAPLSDGPTPWTPPYEMLHEPLASFTAVRGIRPVLSRMPAWNALPLGTAPDQCYIWTRTNSAFHSYLAMPSGDAPEQVAALSDYLLAKANPWLMGHGYVPFERLSGAPGVGWGDLPEIKPFITVLEENPGFLLAGLYPAQPGAELGPVADLVAALSSNTNLVVYSSEDTSARVDLWLPVSQAARMLARRAQLPLESAAVSWLGAIKPRLGHSKTTITLSGPNTLLFERKSIVGLTAAELHLFVDWLESPTFPVGLHTTRVAPTAMQNSAE